VTPWSKRRTAYCGAFLLVLMCAAALAGEETADTRLRADHVLPVVQLDELPPEAQQTLALIKQGGPFPYKRDGVMFGNRERRLPSWPSGYYREYTVPTPGARDRGARRIIAGTQGEYYYTDDHYNTFRRIRE
jgi:ribonuclease T1